MIENRAAVPVWRKEIGSGYRRGTLEASAALGTTVGMKVLGGSRTHDMALTNLRLGLTLTDLKGKGHWYAGNWDLLGEIFGGGQFYPKTAYVLGVTPVLRYSFATGWRWVPFVDAGAGLSLTDIGHPDLSTLFEFNIQGGAGFHWFWTRHWAATVEYRWIHFSNARLDRPNLGVNANLLLAGVTWFF